MSSIDAATLFNVKGQIFVITGAGTGKLILYYSFQYIVARMTAFKPCSPVNMFLGLGQMMANALDVNGASKIFILGRRLEVLEKVANQAVLFAIFSFPWSLADTCQKNKSIVPIATDVTNRDSLAAAVATISAQSPFVNAVIANSGKAGQATHIGGPRPTSVAGLSQELLAFDDKFTNSVFDLNFTGTLNTFASFLPLLDAGNTHPDSVGSAGYVQSQFITLGSIASFSRDIVMDIPYAASKSSLVHLTKMLATEYAPYKIRVNCLAPGLYPSESTGVRNKSLYSYDEWMIADKSLTGNHGCYSWGDWKTRLASHRD
jgi:NAD(P)-dependent dehydrogenase (short-subunit alcohol dehydrogenase family)